MKYLGSSCRESARMKLGVSSWYTMEPSHLTLLESMDPPYSSSVMFLGPTGFSGSRFSSFFYSSSRLLMSSWIFLPRIEAS